MKHITKKNNKLAARQDRTTGPSCFELLSKLRQFIHYEWTL
jgi:hypothetical protein